MLSAATAACVRSGTGRPAVTETPAAATHEQVAGERRTASEPDAPPYGDGTLVEVLPAVAAALGAPIAASPGGSTGALEAPMRV